MKSTKSRRPPSPLTPAAGPLTPAPEKRQADFPLVTHEADAGRRRSIGSCTTSAVGDTSKALGSFQSRTSGSRPPTPLKSSIANGPTCGC